MAAAGAAPENVAQTGGNPFLPGDADCNGAVDGADFIAWNSAKFTNSTAWTTGNFDGNAATDGSDFIVWNSNKFMSSALLHVDEPGARERSAADHNSLRDGMNKEQEVRDDRDLIDDGYHDRRQQHANVRAALELVPSAPGDLKSAEIQDVTSTVDVVAPAPSLTQHRVAQVAEGTSTTRAKAEQAIDAIFAEFG